MCAKLFHLKCTTTSKALYTELKKPDCQVLWFCIACGKGAKNILKSMADLNSKHEALNSKHEALLERVAKLENSGSVSGAGAASPVDEIVQKAVSATVTEMNDLKRRENNVVIFGLDEGDPSDPSHDSEEVKKVLTAIGITDHSFTASRLGKTAGDRPRILRVRFANLTTKYSTLNVAKNLRVQGFPNVYIKPDLTPRQLDEQRALVMAMKSANKDGRRMRISRGRLVPLNGPAEGNPSGVASA
jgi:hypothetical protein